MIHETFLYLTETAFGSHPCRVVSISYRTLRPFHGGNTGSNPVEDANLISALHGNPIRIAIHRKYALFRPDHAHNFALRGSAARSPQNERRVARFSGPNSSASDRALRLVAGFPDGGRRLCLE